MKLGRLAWRLLPVETGMQALHVSWLVDLAADSGLQVIVGYKGPSESRNPRTQAFPGKSTHGLYFSRCCMLELRVSTVLAVRSCLLGQRAICHV